MKGLPAAVVLGIASALVATTGRLNAQARKFDPLVLPNGGPMACRSFPVTPADSAAIVLDIADDGPGQRGRESVAAYDSLGTPLYILVTASEGTPAALTRMHIVAMRFMPVSSGARITVASDGTIVADTTAGARDAEPGSVPLPRSGGGLPPGAKLLADSETVQVRRLAGWFWDHRCGRKPRGQPQ